MAASVRIVLVALLLQACAHKEAAPPAASEAAAEVQQPAQETEAAPAPSNEAAVEAQPPAKDPAVDPAAEPARPPRGKAIAPVTEAAELPACADASAFTALSKVVARPSAGQVAVRGKLWSPVVVRCTAGLPAHCMGEMLLADSKPEDRTARQIALTGQLPDAKPLICAGGRGDVRCPIPTDGAEYGVNGTLLIQGEGEERWLGIAVESLCRF
jgi:hypothetical protein